MTALTYRSLLEEVLDGNLKEMRLNCDDYFAVEGLFKDAFICRFHDDQGIFFDFNDCKIRLDPKAEDRGWAK